MHNINRLHMDVIRGLHPRSLGRARAHDARTRHFSFSLRFVLLLLLGLVAAIDTRAEGHAVPSSLLTATTTTTTTVIVPAVTCPTCPLCFRADTPLRVRWRYCLSLTRTLSNWLHRTTRVVTHHFSQHHNLIDGNSNSDSKNSTSDEYRNENEDAFVKIRSTARELPFAEKADIRREALHNLEHLLHTRIVGQSHIAPVLLEALRRKLWYSREPLVLHLAGDNGVGKTHTARLISQALSLHCSTDRGVCEAGDNLLVVSGTSFDGLPLRQARRRIVRQVMQHAQQYPHGVVLIDDLTAMHPALVRALSPLFGRASHFPEQLGGLSDDEDDGAGHCYDTYGMRDHSTEEDLDDTCTSHIDDSIAHRVNATDEHDTSDSRVSSRSTNGHDGNSQLGAGMCRRKDRKKQHVWDVARSIPSSTPQPPPLSQLLVIVTTDFGQQGRTAGMSVRQIGELVRSEFAEIYGNFLPAYTRTLVYLPFTTDTAAAMVRSVVRTLPCTLGENVLRASDIADDAVHFLVERHRDMWLRAENGHALRRVMEDELMSQVLSYWDEHGVDCRLTAYFVLDEERARVVLQDESGGDDRHGGEAQSL